MLRVRRPEVSAAVAACQGDARTRGWAALEQSSVVVVVVVVMASREAGSRRERKERLAVGQRVEGMGLEWECQANAKKTDLEAVDCRGEACAITVQAVQHRRRRKKVRGVEGTTMFGE
jgi:hypothetical protein